MRTTRRCSGDADGRAPRGGLLGAWKPVAMRDALTAGVRNVGAVSLGALSALHVLWATGSAWPAADRQTLASAIGGFSRVPGPGPCLTVAAALGVAAAAVAGLPEPYTRAGRAASAVTASVLAARGFAGMAGLMPHARRSASFAVLDRRVYSPVALTLACAAAVSTVASEEPF